MQDTYHANEGSRPHDKKPRKRGPISSGMLAVVLLVAVLSFVLGTRSDAIMRAVGPIVGIKVAERPLDYGAIENTYKNLVKYYDGDLSADELQAGANRGIVEAAGDRFTVYMSPKEAAEFEKELSGEIGGGIGAEIGQRNDQPTIIRVLPGNPAEKAGLQAGDTIIGVNDDETAGWTVEKVVGKVRGDVGTSVRMTVLREGEEKEFTITREEVKNPSVESEVRGDTGILKLSRFDDETGAQARAKATELKEAGVKRIVLDLRGNGGGYVTAAQAVAGLWLDDKVVLSEKRGGKTVDEIKSTGEPVLADMPTTILVNSSSASASEIVAGALKEYKVATLVGEKTYGKGSVQQVVDLAGGAKLKVTIAKWYTPKGVNITKEGIKPDKEVGLTAADANAGRDPQLEAALAQ